MIPGAIDRSSRVSVADDLGSLTVALAPGSTLTMSAERLRAACKCAHCTRARIDGRFPEAFPGIAIVDVNDLGYGFNIAFSDGHNKGIYPLTYLAGLTTHLAGLVED